MTTTAEQQQEALHRATTSISERNDQIVRDEFCKRGIDATPRVDVFSFGAWKAKGRQVLKRPDGIEKGEWGVKLTTWITCQSKDTDPDTGERSKYRRPKTVSVFHISQTEAIQ